MSTITTFTGKAFDPVNPEAELIDIVDIAHALSMLCRANGHVRQFYTVGQHSIACCLEAKARKYSKRVQLACLLHDASEAYLSDITRPIKPMLKEYLILEDKLQALIWNVFLGEPLTEEEIKQVFEIDDDMLSYEFLKLMPKNLSDRHENLVNKPTLEVESPSDVEQKLIALAKELR